MKKLIAIAVVFALFAGVAFADVMVGGQVATKAELFAGNTVDNSDITAGMDLVAARANADFTNDSGTAGGRIRLYAAQFNGWWGATPFAFSWWKPMDELKIQLGHNPDGDFGAAQITGWGFNAEAQDFVAIDKDSEDMNASSVWVSRTAGFYGGFDQTGASVSIYPMDGLTINLVVPFALSHNGNMGNLARTVYLSSHVNFVYSIPDTGVVRITFEGKGGNNKDKGIYGKSAGTIFGSFFLTALDGMDVDLGVSFGLPYDTDASGNNSKNPGLGVGLGFRFVGDGFGVKLRAGATLASSTKTGSNTASDPTKIGFVILPYYDLDVMRIYLNAGLGMTIPESGDSAVDFFINPYITKSAGNLTFYAGFKMFATEPAANADRVIKWAVPIGFNSYY